MMQPAWRGPLVLVLGAAALLMGWWWGAVVVALLVGLATRPGGRPFLDAFLGALIAWAVLDAWRILLWQGVAQAYFVADLAGMPHPVGLAFFGLPALVAALAAGFAAAAGARLRTTFADNQGRSASGSASR